MVFQHQGHEVTKGTKGVFLSVYCEPYPVLAVDWPYGLQAFRH
jgi:hypothetical protein